MAFNENTLKGKWLELKGELKRAWGDLTDDELEKTEGDMTAISGLVLQKYGRKQTDASDRVEGILQKYRDKKDQKIEEVKNSLRD